MDQLKQAVKFGQWWITHDFPIKFCVIEKDGRPRRLMLDKPSDTEKSFYIEAFRTELNLRMLLNQIYSREVERYSVDTSYFKDNISTAINMSTIAQTLGTLVGLAGIIKRKFADCTKCKNRLLCLLSDKQDDFINFELK